MAETTGGNQMSNKAHIVQNISFEKDTMQIDIDGKHYAFTLSGVSDKLAKASDIERDQYAVSASGYGIRWHLIDEDISVDGLLGISHKPLSAKNAVKT
jgi:hypothetical protein